jgi:pyruvate/2-oxoglutarate dehydrogenase complex dihydrolipoamide dehydrogenase (E3) component
MIAAAVSVPGSKKVTDFYSGSARFIDNRTIDFGGRRIQGETIVIHTGTRAHTPQIPGIESVPWLDNKGVLALRKLPEHLLVIGGSYIGLEFGQAFRRFGNRVTIFEHENRIIFREDVQISATAQKLLEEEGVEFHLGSEALIVGLDGGEIVLNYRQDDLEQSTRGTHLLVAVGREPVTPGLNLSTAGIKIDERGYIVTDDYGVTTATNIYALGDVNGKGAFTHTSVHDGQVFLEHYLRSGSRRISDRIPIYAMYIDPPLARVGMSTAEAARRGLDYLVGTMPMSAVSRAKEKAEIGGMMQVITDAKTGFILGATIFGVGGDEIIGMLALAMQAGIPYKKLQETVLPHPTVSELVPWIFNDLKKPIDE